MKINILLLLFLAFLANSCGKTTDQNSQIDTYIYENKSGLDLKLTFYKGKSYHKDINILNNQIYTEKIIIKAPATDIDPCIVFSDSVRIVFSDGQTILYRPEDASNNEIYTRYTNTASTGKNKTYTFTLSQQDYELSE